MNMFWKSSLQEHPDYVKENMRSLRTLRAEKNIQRKLLSEKVGISESCLLRYERNGSLPTQESYNKLAEFFGWQKWEAQS